MCVWRGGVCSALPPAPGFRCSLTFSPQAGHLHTNTSEPQWTGHLWIVMLYGEWIIHQQIYKITFLKAGILFFSPIICPPSVPVFLPRASRHTGPHSESCPLFPDPRYSAHSYSSVGTPGLVALCQGWGGWGVSLFFQFLLSLLDKNV